MDNETLRKVQLVELDILSAVAAFCEKHDINYSLAYGTALGAVRHSGFIPWDDDVDIVLLRKDYDKFVRLWKEDPIDGYYLQEEGPETDSRINHTKVRKDNTILASEEEMKTDIHHGIWIDLFSLEKIPTDNAKRKKMLFYAKLRLIYTRRYPYVGHGKALEILSKIMLCIPKGLQKNILKHCEKQVTKYNGLTENYELICPAAPEELKYFFPANTMDEFELIDFEDKKLKINKNHHEALTLYYGDYMQFPPESERICKHNPEVVKL